MMIGREAELAVLRGERERAMTSHGGLVLVVGEAGIGKSTLVAEATRGARVAAGACWEGEGAPAYWPWIQVIRSLGAGGADVFETAESPFELYDAVTGLLVAASPLVVVLEDLHWADAASLKLLEFVVQHTWFERLLIIATLRPDEAEVSAALAVKATTVTLKGLSDSEAAELVATTTRHEPDSGVRRQIVERAGGNPFFVEQLARLWQGGGVLPAAVGAVVDSRLARLPDSVLDTLGTAAVLGRRFRAGVLREAMGREVRADLDQATLAALVRAEDGGHVFVHDLIRETIYARLTDRAERHAAVLAALKDAPPTERAEHAYLAATSDAVDLLLAAAHDAESRLAPEEAVTHYGRALELATTRDRATPEQATTRDPTDRRRQARLLLELGTAQHHAGDPAAARTLDRAVELVGELDDPTLLALAALKLHDLNSYQPGRWTEFVREAHRRIVGEEGSGVGQRGAEPGQVVGAGLDQAADELSQVVAEQARTDDELVYSLLSRLSAIWGPASARERLELTDRMLAVARRTGDPELALTTASWRFGALLELGDPRCLDEHRTIVARADSPQARHEALLNRYLVAALQGRFAEAEECARQARRLGSQPHLDPEELEISQLWSVALLRGAYDEADELAARSAMSKPLFTAVGAVQRGEVARARRLLAEILTSDEQYLRWMSPLWLRFQAQVAALTGDPELCATARAALEPYRDQWALTGTIFVDGPFAHWLAVLDAAQERWEDAEAGFTAAWQAADRLGARPWSVEARARLAEVRHARNHPADLVEEVEAEARELGMLVRLPRPGANVFRPDGDIWTISYAGRTAHLPASKGLSDIHLLLSTPGTDLPASRMLNPAGGEEVVAARSMGGDPVLDDAAKAAYRRRLEQLGQEIDRSAVRQDADRVAALDAERQALLDELRRADGLGGRSRRLGDESERARKAVTNRIRHTLRQLDERHPELAVHLRASLSTGSTCRYQPPAEVSWAL